jgi:hypothetical protein
MLRAFHPLEVKKAYPGEEEEMRRHSHRVILVLELGIGFVYIYLGASPYVAIGVLHITCASLRWFTTV